MSEHRRNARLLTALEVVPGDSRDLTHLMRLGSTWDASALGADKLSSDLQEYLAFHIDEGRVEFWEKRLHELATERPGVRMVAFGDPGYPQNLAASYDAPPFLFIEGAFGASRPLALAIVGSRKASSAGLEIANAVAGHAARIDATIVSGLAEGIDTAAHLGALDAGGRTIAVLPCGIDRLFPPENAELARRIARSGCLVSQFPPGAPPVRSSFLMRNAVISGLSGVSLIVEARERSGTRNEAEHALKQGRQVLLWAPLLGSASWAKGFAREPDVTMVSRVEDVLKCLQSSSVDV